MFDNWYIHPAMPSVVGSPAVESAAKAIFPEGRTEEHFIESAALKRRMSYLVHLPPGYDEAASVRFPVLYLLHGLGGTNSEWPTTGFIGKADDLMRSETVDRFIIVMPQGDQGYWLDQAFGPAWATYLVHDIVGTVDARFRTRPDRRYRAVGGLSMGGYGALHLGMNYTNVFGVVGAHTPTFRDFDGSREWFGVDMATVQFGEHAYFDAHDPVWLFTNQTDKARGLIIRVDVGADDEYFPAINRFHKLLLSLGVKHEWEAFDGAGHGDLEFWKRHSLPITRFYSDAFRAAGGPSIALGR